VSEPELAQRRPVPARFGAGRWRVHGAALRGLAAVLAGIVVAVQDGRGYAVAARLDDWAFDAQTRLVRHWRAGEPLSDESPQVVLVGLDEASLKALDVPLSLLHAPLGAALGAIAAARPRAIGLDIALPEKSFDAVVPGIDRALMQGLEAARAAAPLTLALDADADGRVRIPYAPLLAAAGGGEAFGAPLFPLDCDGVVRRFEPDPTRGDAPEGEVCRGRARERVARASPALPTFAGRLAAQLGRAAALEDAGDIDFTRGAAFTYVPLQSVLAWERAGARQALDERFAGRVVLLGSVLPYLDRLRLPVALAAWEDATVPPPGLVANAQVLRNALGQGLVRAPAQPLAPALVLALAGAALPARARRRYALLALLLALTIVLGTALLAAGYRLAPGAAVLAGLTALAARTVLDLAAAHRQRDRLARRVAGYLSPAVLQAVVDESTDEAGAALGGRRAIALLFADLQDFTRRSEHTDPGEMRALLNRYYAAVTPGLHAHGGAIDNFRGDGIMVLFGAPRLLAQPCDAAFAAAGQMLAQIDRLNREELAPRGIEPVGVTMGLAFGEVVFGELGSPDRRDFTALGDAVNVAAHLQAVAKQHGIPVAMTAVFVQALAQVPAGLFALGLQAIKGHSPLAVWGWSPPAGA